MNYIIGILRSVFLGPETPMSAADVKVHLIRKHLRIRDIAVEMEKSFPGIHFSSAEVMLHQLISGRRWYPKYATWLKERYGIRLAKPGPLPAEIEA